MKCSKCGLEMAVDHVKAFVCTNPNCGEYLKCVTLNGEEAEATIKATEEEARTYNKDVLGIQWGDLYGNDGQFVHGAHL